MNCSISLAGPSDRGEQVVRMPRPGDALGTALRHVYPEERLPDELAALLRQIDRTSSRHH
jgi:hypothetical protein